MTEETEAAEGEAERNRRHAAERKAVKAERDTMMQSKTQTGGLLLVHTGEGKGKSTAGFGMVARALGWGQRVGVVQYIKGKWITGERRFFARFPDQIRFEIMGEGFTWDTQDRARDIAAAEAAWQKSVEMIADPELDFVLLDELNVALRYEYLNLAKIVEALKNRPRDKHICVTGRDAKPELMEIAELVTEMRMIKHPFHQGIKAQRGVDF
jgi:cob(I)alamin adenosyltransferase